MFGSANTAISGSHILGSWDMTRAEVPWRKISLESTVSPTENLRRLPTPVATAYRVASIRATTPTPRIA